MSAMLKQFFHAAVVIAVAASAGLADTVQLKDKATVTGTILAEKKDQVIVDIGYTVLTIPRNQILKVSKGSSSAAIGTAPLKTPGPDSRTPIV